ncbi:MAG: hypothetical protein IR158_11960 [Cellulomonas sp.]|uniref:hypothetical protein n=1 Tax=Cellulomonas sp. TaxID=40001 RepID=UPI0019FF4412|nr:hypothetical protein [Cellulomonas sp.]MBF0688463.1 hypothetical protein [Cellulomonas sp.]
MGVDEEFERVRTALRVEEQALAREFEQIDQEARAAVDASVAQVREQLATQADRIREAIAQQREEVAAHSEELRAEVEGDGEDLTGPPAGADEATDVTDGPEAVDGSGEPDAADEPHAADETHPAHEQDPTGDPHSLQQSDGTSVEQVTHGGDESDERIGDVERGD